MFILKLVVFVTLISSRTAGRISCDSTSCQDLKTCQPLMALIQGTKKHPKRSSVLKFLKTQVCGLSNSIPKVCCPRILSFIADGLPNMQLNESPPCKSSFECVTLSECAPLAYLLSLEKPITLGIVKFIKSQQCGAGTIYPKVCCKFSAKRPRVQTTLPTTNKPTLSTVMPLKQKAEAMNWILTSGFLDFMDFDLFVRRKRNINKREIDDF